MSLNENMLILKCYLLILVKKLDISLGKLFSVAQNLIISYDKGFGHLLR